MPALSLLESRCRAAAAASALVRLRKGTKSETTLTQATADATTQQPPGRRTSTAPAAQTATQTGRLGDGKLDFPL
jgi:hypothetical protein